MRVRARPHCRSVTHFPRHRPAGARGDASSAVAARRVDIGAATGAGAVERAESHQPPRSRVAVAGVAPVMRRQFPALRPPSKPSGSAAEQAAQRPRLARIQAVTQPEHPRLLHREDDAAFALALGRHRGLGEPPQPQGDAKGAVRSFEDLVVGAATGDLAGERDQAPAAEGARQRRFRQARGDAPATFLEGMNEDEVEMGHAAQVTRGSPSAADRSYQRRNCSISAGRSTRHLAGRSRPRGGR